MPAKPNACPCGQGPAYGDCCGRWHAGALHLQAPTPEALMRSRYCAYALGLEDYLRHTWHHSTRPAEPLSLDPAQRWQRLQVKRSAGTAAAGEVEFVAISKVAGRAYRLHERSRFVCEDGRWFYVDGDVLSP